MKIQNINSKSYSRSQTFQANVHSKVHFPCSTRCLDGVYNIKDAFMKKAIIEKHIKLENAERIIIRIKDNVVDLLLIDKTEKLKTAPKTIQMPLQVLKEDICPEENALMGTVIES